MDPEIKMIFSNIIREFRKIPVRKNLDVTSYLRALYHLGKDLNEAINLSKDKAYIYVKFLEKNIIPLIASRDKDNEIVKKFFENKSKIEAEILTPFPKNNTEKAVFHFIYTGELQEYHKNNIRAWAMAHQGKNVTINIWNSRETTILEEFDTAIKKQALKAVETDNNTRSENWGASEKRKFELLIISKNDELRYYFQNNITSRRISNKSLGKKVTNLNYESIKESVINFLSGKKFFTVLESQKAIERIEELTGIYNRDDVSSFAIELKKQFSNVEINYENLYMSTPPSGQDNYIFRDFNHGITPIEGYDLKTLFNFLLIRNLIHGTPYSIANILAPIIIYKEGGVYLPMDSLPEINPDIWNGIKDLPITPSTYTSQEIKDALRSERYDNTKMLLEDYNALKTVRSELIMKKLKEKKGDTFTSEDKIPLKPFPIERSNNSGLYSAFDYIKEREIDDMGLGYKFPQGTAENIKNCVDNFYTNNSSSPEKFFQPFKTQLPPNGVLIGNAPPSKSGISPLLSEGKKADAIKSVIQSFYDSELSLDKAIRYNILINEKKNLEESLREKQIIFDSLDQTSNDREDLNNHITELRDKIEEMRPLC